MYKNNKEEIDDIPFTSKVPITEKVVKWELMKRDVPDENIKSQEKVKNCPFVRNHEHKADFMIISMKGEKLYIEVKGQMTYFEVNKLRFLLERHEEKFYVLQLTEIDWINDVSNDINLSTAEKSKSIYEQQFLELLEFYKGDKTSSEMNELSKQRLDYFVNARAKDIENWENS